MGLLKALLLSLAAVSHASPRYPFETEPLIEPEQFNITRFHNHPSELAPGYIFISPLVAKETWGPQIIDVDGNLVFCEPTRRVQDFKVCDFQGAKGKHLCWHQSRFEPGEDPAIHPRGIYNTHISPRAPARGPPHPVGEKLVFDGSYTQVGKSYTDGIGKGKTKSWPNGHEYNMLPGGMSFIQAVYKPRRTDLRQYTGIKNGWILDGCFQERHVPSGDLIFQWCYYDNLALWQTHLYFVSENQTNTTSVKAGHGVITNPWDFIHLNAVDKTSEGDYLVSGRHLDQIMKIAGPDNMNGHEPGSLIWRLGGRTNDFEMVGNFTFSKQHDVRIISTTANETVFSLFNNAWEGTNEPSAQRSAGLIIAANNVTMQARLLREYPHPDGLLARAMGSMQVLPNKNVIVGWGATEQITEYNENGTVLWHAWYKQPFRKKPKPRPARGPVTQMITPNQEWTYRSVKFPWVGKPFWSPKLLAYKRSCFGFDKSPLLAYVSWNGATEVHSWRFSIARTSRGPWTTLSTVPKIGFETKVDLSNATAQPELAGTFYSWVAVEALDDSEVVIGNVSTRIFIPKPSLRRQCDHNGCRAKNPKFRYRAKSNCIALCEPGWTRFLLTMTMLVPMILAFESAAFLGNSFCRALVYLEAHAKAGRAGAQVPEATFSGRSHSNDMPTWMPVAGHDSRQDGPRQWNYSDNPGRYVKKEKA